MQCGNHARNAVGVTYFADSVLLKLSDFGCIKWRFHALQKCPTPPFWGVGGVDIFLHPKKIVIFDDYFLLFFPVCGSLGVLFCIHIVSGIGNEKT